MNAGFNRKAVMVVFRNASWLLFYSFCDIPLATITL